SHIGFDRQVGVLNRHPARRDRELGKSPQVASLARRHKRFWTEIPYLASDLAWEGGRGERGDPVDRGLAGDESLPEGILADAIRCDHTESRDDDASAMVHAALGFWVL